MAAIEDIGKEKMKQKERVLVIIPAYNEAENIVKVVNHMKKQAPQYDYLIVNDGSTDNTLKLCRQEKFHYLDLPINMGIGGAVQAGYIYAYKNDYDIAVQIDGDGQHDITYLDRLIEPLVSKEADVVIGSRFLEKEGFQSSAGRRMGIMILSKLIWLVTGRKIMDVTSGYRAVNRMFIEIYSKDYPMDYPEPEAIVSAIMHLGRVREVPVQMRAREGGTSSITFKKSIYYMIKVTLAILLCRISYGIRRGRREDS